MAQQMKYCSTNSRSASFSRLLLHQLHHHRNKKQAPSLLPPTHRHNRHVHTATPRRSLSSETLLDSVRGLFFLHHRRPPLHPSTPRIPPPPPVHWARRWYRKAWKFSVAACAAAVATVAALSHKETVPYTCRAHLVILSPSNDRKFGEFCFNHVVKEKLGDKILDDCDANTVRFRLIAADIIRAVHHAFPTNDNAMGSDVVCVSKKGKAAPPPQTGHLHHLDWEVIVVGNDRHQAYALPGGKIVVHTGCLKDFNTDAEIAAIIAHEVAHIVARHFTEFTKVALLIPKLHKLLPFSRRREMEADLIGMMLLATAGYDPRVAPRLYQKIGEINGDSAWKDYFGSHPSCKKRARLLSEANAMEDALESYYKQVHVGDGVN